MYDYDSQLRLNFGLRLKDLKGKMTMNKMIVSAVLVLYAGVAQAAPIYAGLATDGATGDEGGYAERYTAYLCTAEAAKSYFGGNDTYGGVTTWLALKRKRTA